MTTSMREVLEPFLTFAETFVEKAEAGWQWKNGSGSDRVCDWFGPSDFGLLQHFAALASHVEQEPVAALSSPAPDRLSEEERYVIDQSKKQMFDDLGRNSVSNANIEQLLAIIARLSRQPEAEPVAWRYKFNGKWHLCDNESFAKQGLEAHPLYTSPRLDRERLARTLYRRLVLNPPADFDDASADLQNEWLQLADAIMRETR